MQTDLQHAVFSNRQCAAAISASGLDGTDSMLTAWIALVWFLPLSHPFFVCSGHSFLEWDLMNSLKKYAA